MKHLNITVRGKVQRVYFRATTKAVADQLKIKGFVMNQPDGSVYMEAEGEEFALESFVEFCNEGPEGCNVEAVEIEESNELRSFENFVVVKKLK